MIKRKTRKVQIKTLEELEEESLSLNSTKGFVTEFFIELID